MSKFRLTEKPIITDLPDVGDYDFAVDESDGQLYTIDSAGDVKKYFAPTTDGCRIGFADYNDLTTQKTPINFSSGVQQLLTNDKAGAFTNELFLPNGFTSIYNSNQFDWSQLKLGDMVDIRIDLSVTTQSQNQEIDIKLVLGIGAGQYEISFVDIFQKSAGLHRIVAYSGVYMGDTNTLDNPAEFRIDSDGNGSVVVNGWYCKILIRG
jgi:hypothetical protein